MNRYPFWKYAFVGLAVAIGLLYAVPNLFGEAPAVQVSPVKATLSADAALMGRVEQVLVKAGIEQRGAFLDPSGVKVRFATEEVQLNAKDLLQRELGEDYVVALNLQSNVPGWMRGINALPMYLGLDLRGGVHFLLQVDMQGAVAKAADRYAADIRTLLREDKRKVRHAGIVREGESVVVRFRDEENRGRAREAIEKEIPDLLLKDGGAAGEFTLSATLKLEAQKRIQDFALQQNITTLRNRVNELGVAEPIVQQAGADRVVVQLPGVQDTAKAKDIIGRTATLELRMVEAHASDSSGRDYDPAKIQQAQSGAVPFGTELHVSKRGGLEEVLLLNRTPVLTGERLTDAAPSFDPQSGEPMVRVSLDGQGARLMRDATRDAVKRRMAVLLIERGKPEVITAPVIQSELGASFQITGRMNPKEANDLALLLRAGALAAPMDIVEERTVGPSLGRENIEKGWKSTLIGFGAIAVFMVLYYSVFGVISVLALATNLVLLVSLLSMLQATLTLPGIAAVALTLGMAIDANVLINERIREELRNGATPQAAISAGFERAFGTIVDSNITTLIAGVFLFMFGSGPVRGFAVVHCLGILTSMFSAVLVSRALVNLLYGSRRKLDRLPIGNTDWQKRAAARAA
ncbi:MAG: protein translocase subunit SecD [Betaproteobacteria bacterium]|jgi:preprotein translocase subunit SecD|nr:protein translocase subunit SecD [Rhodocyclaceae bacterium]MCA3133384.1 protein translocase subunit SecD [Rhodocyclaceae bacterium]MCA3143273.1 protein translocase subunit SecD [Rhodocyclaceae bacterium]MCA3144597.1 protein translocase subunit SecD [Rhodocyclaceae bacterium]